MTGLPVCTNGDQVPIEIHVFPADTERRSPCHQDRLTTLEVEVGHCLFRFGDRLRRFQDMPDPFLASVGGLGGQAGDKRAVALRQAANPSLRIRRLRPSNTGR